MTFFTDICLYLNLDLFQPFIYTSFYTRQSGETMTMIVVLGPFPPILYEARLSRFARGNQKHEEVILRQLGPSDRGPHWPVYSEDAPNRWFILIDESQSKRIHGKSTKIKEKNLTFHFVRRSVERKKNPCHSESASRFDYL